MFKRLLFSLLAISFLPLSINAQNFNVQKSTPFEEPEDGWNKLMQLHNGNTLFLHFTKKEGIEVIVYNKDRKDVQHNSITSELWEPRKMKASTIEGVYEICGQPVIFLQQMLDRTPTLFRIVLDGNTGSVVSEEQIATLQRYKAGAGYAMMFGHVDQEDFYVEKDPESDNYAVVNFNSFAHESGERIEVVHYTAVNGKHSIVNRAFYDAQGFKYLRFIGMTVNADKNVFICAYGFNTASSGGKDSRVIVSRLSKGEKDFTHKQIEFSDDFKDTKAVMQFNPGTGMIQLLTLTLTSAKSGFMSGKTTSYYMTVMSYIDPETLFIVSAKPVLAKKIDEYATATLKNPKGYNGLPQQMVINKDNSTTLLFEDLTQEIITSSRGSVSYRTYLGPIGILDLDTKGTEQNGYALNKMQMANGIIDPLYISHKSKGLWSYRGSTGFMVLNNNAFLSYDYINTDKGQYFIYNDYPENLERSELRKKKTVVAISDASTMCYKMNNGKLEQSYLFGTPPDDDVSRFCYIESSHFDKTTNTLATLMMERDGRKKNAYIAWVKFD